MGGGTKLIRTLLPDGTDCAGATDGVIDSCAIADGVGIGDSCAEVIWTQAAQTSPVTIRNLNIVPPIHIREQIVAPFAIAQEFVIDVIDDKLIV
jgi:hypothetical protein